MSREKQRNPSPLPQAGGVAEGRGRPATVRAPAHPGPASRVLFQAHPGPASRTCPSRKREGREKRACPHLRSSWAAGFSPRSRRTRAHAGRLAGPSTSSGWAEVGAAFELFRKKSAGLQTTPLLPQNQEFTIMSAGSSHNQMKA